MLRNDLNIWKIEGMVQETDKNHDGEITLDELLPLIDKLYTEKPTKEHCRNFLLSLSFESPYTLNIEGFLSEENGVPAHILTKAIENKIRTKVDNNEIVTSGEIETIINKKESTIVQNASFAKLYDSLIVLPQEVLGSIFDTSG